MIDIVGKNGSITTFPEGFFAIRNSVGLNHAATLFKTTLCFTAHPGITGAVEFPREKIIGIKFIGPTGHIPVDPDEDYPAHTPGLGSYIGYDRLNYLNVGDIKRMVEAAAKGEFEYAYRARKTSLHLCMFWCMCAGYKTINMMGCNNTTQCLEGHSYGYAGREEQTSNERRKMMFDIIFAAKDHGINFSYYENYQDYLDKGGK